MNSIDARALLEELLTSIAPEAQLDTADPLMPMQEELDLDSMDMLNLFTALHDRTGIDVAERDYPRLATIEGFVAYVTAAPQPTERS